MRKWNPHFGEIIEMMEQRIYNGKKVENKRKKYVSFSIYYFDSSPLIIL